MAKELDTKENAAVEKAPQEQAPVETDSTKTNEATNSTKKSTATEIQRKRIPNKDFFKNDILGYSNPDRLKKDVTLKSRTGRGLFNLTYERVDSYFHRPKEISTLLLARDANDQIQKQIENRLTELENYVEKRYKKVKGIYDAATALEVYEVDSSNYLNVKAAFSSGFSNRYLNIILKIDETSAMASYLEKIGEFNIRQEATVTSELYRKAVEISRILMVFIARTIRSVRTAVRNNAA
jgi:hypothetical protein